MLQWMSQSIGMNEVQGYSIGTYLRGERGKVGPGKCDQNTWNLKIIILINK